MQTAWPALCILLALGLLLWLIIRREWHAFLALTLSSLALGLAAGLPPPRVVDAFGKGVGDILRDVAVLLALGAMLGRMLETSGAALVIAQTLVDKFGIRRAPLAILLAGFLIGIPVLFNVGFLLLIPIIWRLQRQTGLSLLYFLLPLIISLGLTHSLVPPHPGIIGAVNNLGGPDTSATMVQTILFGSLLALPLALVGWFGPGLFWARRHFVTVPEQLAAPVQDETSEAIAPPPFALCVLIVSLPLWLSLIGFGAKLLADLGDMPGWLRDAPFAQEEVPTPFLWLNHAPLTWLEFLSRPTMALLIPTLLSFWFLGRRRGMTARQLSTLAESALRDVGAMVFLFGAAGGFKEMIQATGAGRVIADALAYIPVSSLAKAFCVAVVMRIALGSATASILTASALLVDLTPEFAGRETLLVLSVAIGVTFMTQPADTGFWMVKEYGNLSVRDVLFRFNGCRIVMALAGLGILLAVEALF